MDKEYKCSPKRLVKYFEFSRDRFKERCTIYQKEKRELKIQFRDMKRSKEKWKRECLQLRNEVSQLKDKEKKTTILLLKI